MLKYLVVSDHKFVCNSKVKYLLNVCLDVREPDDQHCYLFIPDVKNYPEVLESLIEVVLREADTTMFIV